MCSVRAILAATSPLQRLCNLAAVLRYTLCKVINICAKTCVFTASTSQGDHIGVANTGCGTSSPAELIDKARKRAQWPLCIICNSKTWVPVKTHYCLHTLASTGRKNDFECQMQRHFSTTRIGAMCCSSYHDADLVPAFRVVQGLLQLKA